jgi:hypothetical protein
MGQRACELPSLATVDALQQRGVPQASAATHLHEHHHPPVACHQIHFPCTRLPVAREDLVAPPPQFGGRDALAPATGAGAGRAPSQPTSEGSKGLHPPHDRASVIGTLGSRPGGTGVPRGGRCSARPLSGRSKRCRPPMGAARPGGPCARSAQEADAWAAADGRSPSWRSVRAERARSRCLGGRRWA